MESNKTDSELLKCQDCGKQDKTVRHDYCPFMDDIHNKREDIIICPECYHDRLMEI
jgi:DNA-directed RNA polymerase subunit RPC12/RpoP